MRVAFPVLAALTMSAAGQQEPKTLTGVLMDAACPVLRKKQIPPERGVPSADRYEQCKASRSTTAFALHTDGRLLRLDANGNNVILRALRGDVFRSRLVDEQGRPRWLTVTVQGMTVGEDLLTIHSLRR